MATTILNQPSHDRNYHLERLGRVSLHRYQPSTSLSLSSRLSYCLSPQPHSQDYPSRLLPSFSYLLCRLRLSVSDSNLQVQLIRIREICQLDLKHMCMGFLIQPGKLRFPTSSRNIKLAMGRLIRYYTIREERGRGDEREG